MRNYLDKGETLLYHDHKEKTVMAFMRQLSLRLTEKEGRALFLPGQSIDDFYAHCMKLGKKYDLPVPQRLRRTLRERSSQPSQDVFGRGPVRVTIYVYPWMLERIDRWAKKRRTTRRQVFLECLVGYLNENEKYYGK